MLGLALVSSQLTEQPLFLSIIHGLKLLAVVVVADATWGMYQSFCKDKVSVLLCTMTAIALLLFASIWTQIVVLFIAALIGKTCLSLSISKDAESPTAQESARKPASQVVPLILFVFCLFGLPLIAPALPALNLFSEFFQAGSLVFGGGHVVLPLLQNIVGDQLSQDAFLTGYAAAQAVPGPMFTFATYIGYELLPNNPLFGAIIATIGVFLPGFLLLLAALNNWQQLAVQPRIAGAIKGVNASVVGLLLAALYDPVFTSAVFSSLDIALILIGLVALKQFKLPIVWLVLFFITSAAVIGFA
jgi:chromate transporter